MSRSELLYSLLALAIVVASGLVAWIVRRGKALPPSAPSKVDALPSPSLEKAAPVKGRALTEGLEKTRSGFIARIGDLLGAKKIDAAMLPDLEEILFTADIGARTANKLLEAVRQSLSKNELKDADAVWRIIRAESQAILSRTQAAAPPLDYDRAKPFLILMIGVNGVGKTTTIGKIAEQLRKRGKKVLLAAGDTFRAAATEQLEIWGQRVGAPVVKGKEGGDPSSVIFEAAKRAQAEGFDVVIADTAGRLHTKTELMQELEKVRRVIQKVLPDGPHETFLVLDSTNGQNAIAQATLFKQVMAVSGIVLTKLDGTAKGGVVLGISDELGVPVRYVGVGEKVDDLREFDPNEFVAALYPQNGMPSAA